MFNLRFVKDYLLYRLKAKTRHGTHSPFVYRLVDKVVYDFSAKKVYNKLRKVKDNQRSAKINQLIYRLVADWNPDTVIELGSPLGITSQYINEAEPEAKLFSELADNPGLIFINSNDGGEALGYFEQCLLKVNASTLIIVDGIYANKNMKQAWAQIKAHPKVTVTIDMFWIGLVYFKTGQAKEDFVISI